MFALFGCDGAFREATGAGGFDLGATRTNALVALTVPVRVPTTTAIPTMMRGFALVRGSVKFENMCDFPLLRSRTAFNHGYIALAVVPIAVEKVNLRIDDS